MNLDCIAIDIDNLILVIRQEIIFFTFCFLRLQYNIHPTFEDANASLKIMRAFRVNRRKRKLDERNATNCSGQNFTIL